MISADASRLLAAVEFLTLAFMPGNTPLSKTNNEDCNLSDTFSTVNKRKSGILFFSFQELTGFPLYSHYVFSFLIEASQMHYLWIVKVIFASK